MAKKILPILWLLIISVSLNAQQTDTAAVENQSIHNFSLPEYGYVVLNEDTLFTIKAQLGRFSPVNRAETITKRLKQLKKMPRIVVDSFAVITDVNYSIIMYNDFIIMSISGDDVRAEGIERDELTRQYLSAIQAEFEKINQQRSLKYWVLHILYTLLAIVGLFVIFKLINRFYVWLNKFVEHHQQRIKKKRKSFWRYLAPKGSDSFVTFALKVSKILLLALILFLYLPLMFSFLPWTQDLVNKFYAFISVPLKKIFIGLWLFISQKLIYIVIIFYVSKYLLHILSYVTREIENEKLKVKGFHRDWAKPTYNLVKILVITFTFVFMFPYLPGSDSKAFQGVSIFLGVLFSLGSTSAISNIVAGIVITYMRPFQIGDRVKIGDTIGDIVEKNLLVTRIITIKNEDVTIPNATIINTHLWNYSKNASKMGIVLHTSVTIGYDVPSKVVSDLLIKAANNTPNLTRDFKPFVLQKSLDDFYVEYELNVYTKQPNKMAHFYSELHKSILDEFNRAGVEIMSPHYTAYRDGNKSTIPGGETNPEPKPPKDPVTKVVEKMTGTGKKKS